MPKLKKDPSAALVYRVSDVLPSCNLLIAMNARRSRIANSLRGNLRGFSNDQARRRSLPIIGRHQFRWNISLARAIPRHGRHGHAAGKLETVELIGRKQIQRLSHADEILLKILW